jgi:predicted CXXCH cytochrome family protein
MVAGARLLFPAGIVWLAATVVAVTNAQQSATPSVPTPIGPGPTEPATIVSNLDYVGSAACADCHEADYRQWERSLHVRMTKPVAEALIVGDFTSGARFADHGRAFEFGTRDGRPFMRISFGGREPETFSVDYTLGAKRYQGYLSTLEDGRIYVLPAFWHVASRRWVDWKEITPVPDGAHDLRQIWNLNCFNCHATNLAQGFDPASKTYKSTWTEMGIGCEACHGPGRPHAEMMEEWKRDPTKKPGYDKKIFSPRAASPRQVYDTCSYCHGNKNNFFVGFRAGDRYEDYALPFLISEPIPENDFQGEFWPDGRPNRFNRPQALTLSGCFKAGAIACTNCHVSHGSSFPFSLKVNVQQGRAGDSLCTQCHVVGDRQPATGDRQPDARWRVAARSPDPAASAAWTDADIERHTFHNAASEGSRCIGCHMSDVNWRLLIRRRDHTFEPPVPEITAGFGVPNACTTCHDDRTPEWAATRMDAWWGDGARRQAALALADTMYRAGSKDASTIPALARVAVDRSRGLLVRASAVDYIRQLVAGTSTDARTQQSQTSFGYAPRSSTSGATRAVTLAPEIVNAIIGAAADPEPTVRAAAVHALGALERKDNILAALLARLVDPARVVRMRAAEALLTMGVSELPGRAGSALSRAQDEYVLGMSMFPDAAWNHTASAWMQGERGHVEEARRSLDTALSLDPRLARPWVVRGVLAAREARFAEAIDAWKKARDLEPGYPNIDRLIAEAEARKK